MNRFGFDFSAARATLSNRNFAVFTLGNSVSLIGIWVQRVAVGWLTWQLTESGTWLGSVAMAEFLPVVVMAPIMGVLADRFDKRRIAVVGQIIAGIQAALLAGLTLSGHITPLMILLLQIVSGLVQPLIQTARLVLVPSMVGRDSMANAIALTSLTFNIARITGPALSAVLITAVGAGYSFALNALSYVVVITALMNLRLPPHQYVATAHPSVWAALRADMVDGWKYTFTHPTLKWLMPLVLTASTLTWPITDLMAGIADHTFGRGAGGLAVLTSAQGVGAIAGALFLAQRRTHHDLYAVLAKAMIVAGLLTAAFVTIHVFWLAVPVLGLSASFGVVVGAGSQTVAQTEADDHMRGRTLSVWYTVTRLGPAVGALGLGSLANIFGFTAPLVASGLISATAAALYLRRWQRANLELQGREQ
jgi:MFS family permease